MNNIPIEEMPREIARLEDENERLKEDVENYVKIVLHDRKEIERLNNIIKEVREYIYRNAYDEKRKEVIEDLWVNEIKDILEILDKENI